MSADTALMTVEEFLALPDDGTERELIGGEVREKPMTYRNRVHAWIVAEITFQLKNWLRNCDESQGEVYSGEVGCILQHEPSTVVGIDVAYFAHTVTGRQTDRTTLIDGVPLLAIEVLSPSDRQSDVHEKVSLYLDANVQAVWIVDPFFQTVQVHRQGAAPQSFNREETLSGSDVLPGLTIAVADLFSAQP
jgi:Uma2 family endonuclease